MATLREYFKKDQSRTLCVHKNTTMKKGDTGEHLLDISTNLHIDFESNALFISFFVPHSEKVECPSRIVLNSIDEVLAWRNEIYVEGGFTGEEASTIDKCVFTGRIYIYSEDDIKEEDKQYLRGRAAELGQNVKFREQSYADARNKHEKPLAFISHDSRDKDSIASPLAIQLQKFMCPVWYDEYSLKVGDSLREQIEKGLKECRKCILVLTPNYLSNKGWGKKEFDSVFTRELIEKKKVILPVWHGVSKKEVYEYSPALADRVAVNWSEGVENVARKLKHVVEST